MENSENTVVLQETPPESLLNVTLLIKGMSVKIYGAKNINIKPDKMEITF